jgi:hypothetical protein
MLKYLYSKADKKDFENVGKFLQYFLKAEAAISSISVSLAHKTSFANEKNFSRSSFSDDLGFS